MSGKNESLFWKKKEWISFILSVLVLFIHSYFAPDAVSNSLISVVNHKFSFFFSRSITQFAVPMFFILSGITFFKEYDNRKYFTKIKSRVHTLLIPYLLWNTIWMLWEVLGSRLLATGEPYPLTLANILKGVFFYGCNMPFWFLFDIIVFSFAAPVLFWIIRNKYIGIAAVVGLSVVSLFGVHIPAAVFYYPMSIVFYLIGAIIGYHFFDRACQKSSRPMQLVSIILLAAYILATNIVPRELQFSNYCIETVVFTAAAFALWNITDLLIERIKPRAIYRRSFAVYAMHLNVAIVILKVLSLCIPRTEWLEIPKFIIMVVFTLTIIHYASAFLEKFLPRVYAVLMGNRVRKSQ